MEDLPGLFPGFDRFDESRIAFLRMKQASASEGQVESPGGNKSDDWSSKEPAQRMDMYVPGGT